MFHQKFLRLNTYKSTDNNTLKIISILKMTHLLTSCWMMWSQTSKLIFVLNSSASQIVAFLLQFFGFYVVIKTLIRNSEQEISSVAVFAIFTGVFLILPCFINSIRISFVCHGSLLLSCGSGIWMSLKHSQEFQEFFSHEISILWTLKDSSRVYQKTVQVLSDLVDCCKVHTLVSLQLKL